MMVWVCGYIAYHIIPYHIISHTDGWGDGVDVIPYHTAYHR